MSADDAESQGQETAAAPIDDPQADDLRECPFCKEMIKAAAVLCRYCRSPLAPTEPGHGGICPYCKEQINEQAIRCRYCQSDLRPVALGCGTSSTAEVGSGLMAPPSGGGGVARTLPIAVAMQSNPQRMTRAQRLACHSHCDELYDCGDPPLDGTPEESEKRNKCVENNSWCHNLCRNAPIYYTASTIYVGPIPVFFG